jgi:hypothetical protein
LGVISGIGFEGEAAPNWPNWPNRPNRPNRESLRAGCWIGAADSGLRRIARLEGIDVVPVRLAGRRVESARPGSDAAGEEQLALAMMKSRNR